MVSAAVVMTEPACSGRDLVRSFGAPLPPDFAVALWPLGQAGFAIRFGEVVVVIDLYLSNQCEAVLARPFDHRRTSRAPLDAAEITMADLAICTHDHLDHLDVPTIRTLGTASPQCVAVVPATARDRVVELDWEPRRVVGTQEGDRVTVAGLEVEAFGVAHEGFDIDDELGHPYQGYLLRGNGASVAHVGDAMAEPRLADLLVARRPDVLLLPINGRSAERARIGFAGNMNAEEAADLAAHVGAGCVVPMHVDMFAQNVDADALGRFLRACRERAVPVSVPDLGAPLFVPAILADRTDATGLTVPTGSADRAGGRP